MGMNTETKKRLLQFCFWLVVAAVIVILDHVTKYLASENLTLYRPVPVTSWLNLTLAHNTGAAFSLFADASGWQRWFFIVVGVLVTLVLLVWLARQPPGARLLPATLALVIGGALGNLVDRIVHGYVVDFIDVYYAGWHWPAFNLADSAICVGVILLLVEGFLPSRKES